MRAGAGAGSCSFSHAVVAFEVVLSVRLRLTSPLANIIIY